MYLLVASVGMAAIVVFVGTKLSVDGIPKFVLMVATGVVVDSVAILGMEKRGNYGIRDVFRTMVGVVGE